MYEQITLERGHCTLCGTWGQCISLPLRNQRRESSTLTCERCLRAGMKAADVLKVLREAKVKPPKKVRKGRKSRASGPPLHPAKERVSSLIPPVEDAP